MIVNIPFLISYYIEMVMYASKAAGDPIISLFNWNKMWN